MRKIHIAAPENTPDFNAVIKRATAIADEQLGNNKQSDDNVRMECAICWEVYDPILGDPVWQIAPGTPFSQLPEHWTCPNCDAPKHKFMVENA